MVDAWVNEYNAVGVQAPDLTGQALQEPAPVEQKFTFTTSTQSNAFGANTHFIAFRVSAAAHMQVGSSPTATVNTYKISADTEYVRAVLPGDKIAFYDGVT